MSMVYVILNFPGMPKPNIALLVPYDVLEELNHNHIFTQDYSLGELVRDLLPSIQNFEILDATDHGVGSLQVRCTGDCGYADYQNVVNVIGKILNQCSINWTIDIVNEGTHAVFKTSLIMDFQI